MQCSEENFLVTFVSCKALLKSQCALDRPVLSDWVDPVWKDQRKCQILDGKPLIQKKEDKRGVVHRLSSRHTFTLSL